MHGMNNWSPTLKNYKHVKAKKNLPGGLQVGIAREGHV